MTEKNTGKSIVIGGIGVSGRMPDVDEKIAEAGASAVG